MEGNFFLPAEMMGRYVRDGNIAAIEKEVERSMDKEAPYDSKFKEFQNNMFRYQQHLDQMKKPVETKFTFNQPPPPKFLLPDDTMDFETPLNSPLPSPIQPVIDYSLLPPTKRDKAKAMVDHLSKNPDFTVNSEGKIGYKGQVVQDSNIFDLVNDFGRTHKQKPVAGADLFAKALRETNTPLSFIDNKNRHSLVTGGSSPRLLKNALKGITWTAY